MERLGLGPQSLLELNRRLIYARLTGFGQDGPYSRRAGHDLNYLAMSGVLSLFTSGGKPCAPMNTLADFAGGGMTCAMGILMAIIERQRSNLGQVVDVSMVEGTRYISSYMWHTQKESVPARQFIWPNLGRKEANLLDGGAHFYTVYKTRDGRWISVGAIEPQFYSALLKTLSLDEQQYSQFELDKWPEYKEKFAELFAQRDLADWVHKFRDVDACVEPVLELGEVEETDTKLTRPSFNNDHTPVPAPRLSRTPGVPNTTDPLETEHTAEILHELGYEDQEILELARSRTIDCKVESRS